MLLAGLTGGVGAGKSSVGRLLERRGAIVLDADEIAREVVAPGSLGFDAVRARFGRSYITPEGTIDRAGLAQLVFSDEDARSDLNAMLHPLIREVMQARTAVHQGTDDIVVQMIPLFVESGRYSVDFLIVVDCDEAVAADRLVRDRGWTEREARGRIAAQASREERRAVADFVVDNSGDTAALSAQIDAVWSRLLEERLRRSA